jgi:hypothetical protein
MTIWKKLAEFIFTKERRKNDRQAAPGLAAFFWTGGAPIQHGIRDISPTGLYLLTEERWYLGTIIVITLQRSDAAEGSPERSVAVQSKAVRYGEDGVGLEFLLPETRAGNRGRNMLNSGADRGTLEKFLKGLSPDNGYATVHRVESSSSLTTKASGTESSPENEIPKALDFDKHG